MVVLIDGFNVYFSFALRKGMATVKWLDYRKLCRLIIPKSADPREILYFTAYDRRSPDKVERCRRAGCGEPGGGALTRAARSGSISSEARKVRRR